MCKGGRNMGPGEANYLFPRRNMFFLRAINFGIIVRKYIVKGFSGTQRLPSEISLMCV